MTAITTKNYDIFKLLIDHPKININHKNKNGMTAFLIAVETNQNDICSLLFDKDGFNIEENNFNLAFYISNPEIAKLLLSIKSIDVNYIPLHPEQIKESKTKDKNIVKSSLTKPITNNNMELLDLTIQHPSFKINRYPIIDALNLSIITSKVEFFEKILQLAEQINIDVNSKIFDGNSSLVNAIINKSSEEMIFYILSNHKFDSKKSDIVTAFYNSYKKINVDRNKRVYKRSNNNNSKVAGKGFAPIFLAKKFDPGPKAFGGFGKAIALKSGSNSNNIIKMLYDYDCEHDHLIDLSKPDVNNITVLEHAIKTSSNGFAIFLINSGQIDLSKRIQTKDGYTTFLHMAIDSSNDLIANEIISRKLCDINITDSAGETPLMIACRRRRQVIINNLFDFGDLDFLHRNNNGEDAMKIAKDNCKNKAIQDEELKEITDKDEYLSKLNDMIKGPGLGGRFAFGGHGGLGAMAHAGNPFKIPINVKKSETNNENKSNNLPGKFSFGVKKTEAEPGKTIQGTGFHPPAATSKFSFGVKKTEAEPGKTIQGTGFHTPVSTSKFSFGVKKSEAESEANNENKPNNLPGKFSFGVKKTEAESNEIHQIEDESNSSNENKKSDDENKSFTFKSVTADSSKKDEQVLPVKSDQMKSFISPPNEIKARDVTIPPSHFDSNYQRVSPPRDESPVEPEIGHNPRIRMMKMKRRSGFQSDDDYDVDDVDLDDEEIFFEDEYQRNYSKPKRRRHHSHRHHHYYDQQMLQQQQQQIPYQNQLLILRQQQQQWEQMVSMNYALQAQLNMQLMNQSQMIKKQSKKKRRGKSVK